MVDVSAGGRCYLAQVGPLRFGLLRVLTPTPKSDFLSYSLFACTQLRFPADESVLSIIARWIFGWTLIVANIFIKVDAHKAIGNYSWYWGDTFWQLILQEELVFDGVYEVSTR